MDAITLVSEVESFTKQRDTLDRRFSRVALGPTFYKRRNAHFACEHNFCSHVIEALRALGQAWRDGRIVQITEQARALLRDVIAAEPTKSIWTPRLGGGLIGDHSYRQRRTHSPGASA